MSPGERDIILEQSLATEENLRVALLIGAAFDDLRCRIITRFAECLGARLRERFAASASWQVSNGIGVDGYLQAGGSLSAILRVGGERVCVRLMYDKSPEIMYYAILKEKTPGTPRLNWGHIKQALDERFAVGKANASCRWMSPVDHAYRNWYNPETLLKLWKKDEAATYFTNRLAAIMGIVTSVLKGK
jgi:hypothetical protein